MLLHAFCGYALCPAFPLAFMRRLSEPRLPIFILSPSILCDVGSPVMQASKFFCLWSSASSSAFVPKTAGPSSSPVSSITMEPFLSVLFFIMRAVAAMKAATEPFMSTLPLAIMNPFFICAWYGGASHRLGFPSGTVSRCPQNARVGFVVPIRAYRFSVVFSLSPKEYILQ